MGTVLWQLGGTAGRQWSGHQVWAGFDEDANPDGTAETGGTRAVAVLQTQVASDGSFVIETWARGDLNSDSRHVVECLFVR